MGLALEWEGLRCDDDRAVLTEGQQIAWRRDRLGWNQRTLAKRAKVGLATITRIEKDRNVQQVTLKAVLAALDAGEKQRPDLLGHSKGEQLDAPKERAADVPASAKLQRVLHRIEGLEVFVQQVLEQLRQAKAEITEDVPVERREPTESVRHRSDSVQERHARRGL